MSISPFDSALYRDLFGDAEIARLFTDSAEVRAMMLVEGTLAKVQGAAGIIPEDSALFLHRSAMELQIDPAGLAAATGQNGVPVPALVAAFPKALEAPDHAQYLHWGATSQDIMDTALALRLRQALSLIEARAGAVIAALGILAEAHTDTPMAAQTYGQIATPTSFGAVLASWGWPLIGQLDALPKIRTRVAAVSLSGAAGTASVLGPDPAALRAELAKALGLSDPGHSTHSIRDGMTALAGWLTALTGSLGKMGEDLLVMSQSTTGEMRFAGAGASSTMPQKQNPVGASVLVALSRHIIGLNTAMQGAGLHRQQRDGAAWFTEWLTLPAMVMAAGRALGVAENLLQNLQPQIGRMAENLADPLGLIHAEALSFTLARHMPRPEAQAKIKALCHQAIETNTPLPELLRAAFPDLTLDVPIEGPAAMGQAPAEARDFAKHAKAIDRDG